jgi:hypothetical protein
MPVPRLAECSRRLMVLALWRSGVQEVKQVFEKLHKYIGKSIKSLIERPDDPHCLRLHKNVRSPHLPSDSTASLPAADAP